MRLNILVLALLSSATAAQAGSIDVVATGTDAPYSIEKINCPSCVAKPRKPVESVVELAPGTQRIEIREIDGVKKIYRTEAWLGGSPVVMVSKALPDVAIVTEAQRTGSDDVAAIPATITEKQPATTEANMIDEKSTTAAVSADMGAETRVEAAPKAAAFDPDKLEFRLN